MMGKYDEYPYVCPVCGKYHYETIAFYEICPFCGWEDDPAQADVPNDPDGANGISLNEARTAYQSKQKAEGNES